jgi:hypothetical protein
LPRLGFKAISVKEGVADRFSEIVQLRKKENPKFFISNFLTELLDKYEADNNNNFPVADD